MKSLLILILLFVASSNSLSQCANPIVLLTENFNTGPINGVVTSSIYGNGFWDNPQYIISGNGHGWFNVIDGIGDVDIYRRQFNANCIGQSTEITFFIRHSFGNTNVTLSAIDDLGTVLQTLTMDLNTFYEQVTLNFIATTSNITFVVHCNSIGGNGKDICMEDLMIRQCIQNPLQNVSLMNPTCNGDLDGQILLSCPNTDEYSFDGGVVWQSDSFLLNIGAGTYNVCSRSLQGCLLVCQNVTIIDPLIPTLTIIHDSIICENGTAQLNASAFGGTSFIYNWSFTSDTNGIQFVSPLTNTSYSVYAENENGCLSDTQTINVNMYPPLTGTISNSDTICPGFTSNVSATVTGGLAPYTFIWSTGQVETNPNTSEINVSPIINTTYNVTINDGCGLTPLELETNVIISSIVPSLTVLNPDQCEPALFQIVNTTPNTQFNQWSIANQTFTNQDTIYTSSLNAGIYSLQLNVTSEFGCSSDSVFTNLLEVHPIPQSNFSVSQNSISIFNTQIQVSNLSTNGNSYQWLFENGVPSTSTSFNSETMFPEGIEGTYTITLITTSDWGCIDTMILPINVYPETLIYAPNSFTPDGDEFNQTWHVYMTGIDIYDFELLIYNRWGELIWESNNIEIGWDGTYKNQICPQGTYTWTINAKNLLNDSKVTYKGHLNLMR